MQHLFEETEKIAHRWLLRQPATAELFCALSRKTDPQISGPQLHLEGFRPPSFMLPQNAERVSPKDLPAALLSWLFADIAGASAMPHQSLLSSAFRQMLNGLGVESRPSEFHPLPLLKRLSPAQTAWQERYRRRALQSWLEKLRETETYNNWHSLAEELELRHLSPAQSTLPWQNLLRQYLHRNGRTRLEDSYRRPSKRYGRPPGLRLRRRQRLAVAVDTSASISEDMLAAFWRELTALQSSGAQITLLQFDDRIRQCVQLQGAPPRRWTGRGNTLYDPLIRWAENKRPDALLIFTDGLGPRPVSSGQTPLLWLIAGPPKPYFEHWDGNFLFM